MHQKRWPLAGNPGRLPGSDLRTCGRESEHRLWAARGGALPGCRDGFELGSKENAPSEAGGSGSRLAANLSRPTRSFR